MSAPAVAAPAPRTRGAAAPAPRPQHVPAPWPRHLRLVGSTTRTRWRPSPITLVAAGTALVLLALVVVHVLLAQSQLTLDRLNTRVGAAQRSYEQALLQRAELAAPSRIIARAGQLGLTPPAQPAVAVPVTPTQNPIAAHTVQSTPRP